MTTQKIFSIFSILFILILLTSCSSISKCHKMIGIEKQQCQEDIRLTRKNYEHFERFNNIR